MTRKELIENIRSKNSFLCVGLDPDLERMPKFLLEKEDTIFEFNKIIFEATKDFCVAYKPNIAFYEVFGTKGWESLEKTVELISGSHLLIADAKRGDIGNTSKKYAKTFFETYNFDAITLAPYMGSDSIEPFLDFKEKWAFLLALTSNPGAQDFQFVSEKGQFLYEKVLDDSKNWERSETMNLAYVVGATRPEQLAKIREKDSESFFLVPGVGAQGGSLEAVWNAGKNADIGLLVNVGRDIIYARDKNAIRKRAEFYQKEMARLMGK